MVYEQGRNIAVVMAGGAGERFWPVSTKDRPKQFLKLASPDATLLEQAVGRAADLAGIENTYIATGRHLALLSAETCRAVPPGHILAEPSKKNTAGCLIWVAANLIAEGPGWESVGVSVLTADHLITPHEGFIESARIALEAARNGNGIATIGIPPNRPETGYGYIETGGSAHGAFQVLRFREKPDLSTAEEYLAQGGFLWNSGMFFYTLGAFMRELTRLQPDMASVTIQAAEAIARGHLAEAEHAFESLPSLSIDLAVMERAEPVFVVPAKFSWDDLGSWDSVARSYPADSAGNVAQGSLAAIDSEDCVVYSDEEGVSVHLLGVQGLVVVVTHDRVLVCPKSRAQEVKRFLGS